MADAEPPEIEIVQSAYAKALDEIVALGEGPVLQIGAKANAVDHKARNWRARFAGKEFVGADLEPGDNVDAVLDICAPFAEISARLGGRRFATIICAHLLEHLRAPWIAAPTIEALLAPGGLLFIQAPWVQAYHPFPEDYWRFSFAGVAAQFPGVEFVDMFYSGESSDVIYRVLRHGRPEAGPETSWLEARLFQVLLTAEENKGFLGQLKSQRLSLSRGYMPVAVVNLVGRRNDEGTTS
jgi:SAM-dependent methyltransferase